MGPGHQRHHRAGIRVRRDHIARSDVAGVNLTTPVRTAFDLAGWAPTVTERVTAVDTLTHRHGFGVDEVRVFTYRELGAHHTRDLDREAMLAGTGWTVLRFNAWLVHNRPDAVADEVATELQRRAG